MTLRIDHVVYAVHDLEAAAARFREAFGLVTTAGWHPPTVGNGEPDRAARRARGTSS